INRNPGWDAYWKQTILIVVAIKVVCLAGSGGYNKWWRYLSLPDLNALFRALAISSIALLVAFSIVKFPRGVIIHPYAAPAQLKQLAAPTCIKAGDPAHCVFQTKKDGIRSGLAARPARQRAPAKRALLLDLVFTLILLGGARVAARSLIERPRRGSFVSQGKKVLIVGAGDAGNLILREMLSNRLAGYTPIGLIDDDRAKLRYRFQGVKVLGTTAQLPEILKARQPDEVHIAMPAAGGRKRAAIVATCRDAGIPVKTLPNVNDLVNGDVDLVAQLREVQVEDVLGREAVALDPAAVGAYVRGRVVLVTGAGGSIGSELCRQLARMEVGRLVMADHAENNLFQIDRELRDTTQVELVPEIADVRDPARMETVFALHQPAVVFHAAAYKHVPLMEQHPVQALRNNALATRTVARLAARHGVDRFVLVSTDKAVYPKTAMGASKALAEWVVEALGQVEAETTFVAVRFGNVLGSSGSVVPIFREQIARGGPVTVTSPEMTRYFMTINEAAQLIVQAGGVGQGGDVFVLDMGDPVKIIDLAHDMIRLSGLEPERDIQVVITGIRPGEKLHEGLFEDSEDVERTHHEKLMRARRAPISPEWLDAELDAVERMANDGDEPGALARGRAMIANPRRADSEQPSVAAPA
ncbi:MAG TPA: nucleoside-diphosphate sugar epimerase/dehydratase, partial [Gaiellales bacterium]